jgi:hypothetical protein
MYKAQNTPETTALQSTDADLTRVLPERLPANDYGVDVLAERPDPVAAYAAFEQRHARWHASPSDLTWHEFRRAYREFRSVIASAALDALWKAKRNPQLKALLDFGVERERRYAKSDKRKSVKARYDKRNAQTEHRQQQCRDARARYKTKQREGKKNGGKS